MANSEDFTDPVPYPPDQFNLAGDPLPGWPGYRTRPGRSGYDYIDTQIELAHMTGVLIRQFFTGLWHRRSEGLNPAEMFIVGLALIFAFPGGAEVCPGVIFVLLIIGVVSLWTRYIHGHASAEEDDNDTAS